MCFRARLAAARRTKTIAFFNCFRLHSFFVCANLYCYGSVSLAVVLFAFLISEILLAHCTQGNNRSNKSPIKRFMLSHSGHIVCCAVLCTHIGDFQLPRAAPTFAINRFAARSV